MALSEIEWPPELPDCPQRSGFSSGLTSNTIRTEFETGTPRVRKRSSAGMEQRTVQYALTDDQKNILGVFLLLYEGRSFWWKDETGTRRYVRIKSDNLDTLFTPLAQGMWTASLSLEVWPYVTG